MCKRESTAITTFKNVQKCYFGVPVDSKVSLAYFHRKSSKQYIELNSVGQNVTAVRNEKVKELEVKK